jgi:hypothetical protein
MADQPTTATTTAAATTRMQDHLVERKLALLGEIGGKWNKFSKQELSDLKNSDDLVTQVVAKYGLEKDVAQRDVNALVKGRTF